MHELFKIAEKRLESNHLTFYWACIFGCNWLFSTLKLKNNYDISFIAFSSKLHLSVNFGGQQCTLLYISVPFSVLIDDKHAANSRWLCFHYVIPTDNSFIHVEVTSYLQTITFIIQHIDTLPKYGQNSLEVRRSTWRISNDRCKF